MEIAELAVERAGDALPRRVVVEVGKHTAVLPDALAFAWQAAIEGTTIDACVLEIVQTEGEELRLRELEVT
jgi:hydrogenase nickel incorporation protein HypA/HybF